MIHILKAFGNSTEGDPVRQDGSGFVDLRHDIDARLTCAREKAEAIVAEAQGQADQIRLQAAAQGKQEALRVVRSELQQDADERLKTALAGLEEAVRLTQQERSRHVRQCEGQVVRLAVAIAEKLVRAELTRQPDIPLRLVREALELASGSQRLKLHFHPDDCVTLRDGIGQLTKGLNDDIQIEIVSDADISRGGCVIRTESGVIDQQFEAQLARIQEELA